MSLSHTQNIYDDSLQLLKSVGFGVETVRYTGTLVRDRSLGTMIDRLFVTVVSSSCTHPRLLDGWRCFSGVDQDDTPTLQQRDNRQAAVVDVASRESRVVWKESRYDSQQSTDDVDEVNCMDDVYDV